MYFTRRAWCYRRCDGLDRDRLSANPEVDISHRGTPSRFTPLQETQAGHEASDGRVYIDVHPGRLEKRHDFPKF